MWFRKKKEEPILDPNGVALSITASGGLVTVRDGSRVLFDGTDEDAVVAYLALASVLGTGQAAYLLRTLKKHGVA